MPCFRPTLIAFTLALVSSAARAEEGRFADWVARRLSAQVRQMEGQRSNLLQAFDTLPQSAGNPTSARLGWHTKILSSPTGSVWVQVDLGHRLPLDAIALVPAHGAAQDAGGAGYGFPVSFRVELADDAAFSRSEIVADQTAVEVPNPRELPFVVSAGGRAGRFVRVTVTKPWQRREDWVVALGELIVLSGGRNVATARPVTASNSLTSLPAWEAANLTDGQSLLGPPVAREPSPSNGYLAAQEARADLVKWVQVDLGRAVPIEAVRLFPSRPQDFADTPGNGFPVRFRVEAANEAAFSDAVKLFETGEQDFVNPGDNPVTIPADGQRARFLRVTATRLYNRGEVNSFALAEMQVWSGGENVALGKQVTALDRFDVPQYPRWQPEFLVDGFNSKNRILGDAEWLAGLARRRELAVQLATLEHTRALAADAALAFIMKAGVGSVGGVFLLAGVLLWRARTAKRRAVEELRTRIASDLHDEIGSQLGSIALAAQLAARRADDPAAARERLAEIERIARDTSDAMHDMVWLLKPGSANLTELTARLRETAAAQLQDREARFELAGETTARPLSIEFTRNVYLLFKETLANVVKHSGAKAVGVRLAVDNSTMQLTICDDGVGFDATARSPGNGLDNMRRRAEQIGATLRIASAPGKGTTITLAAPIR